MDDLHEPEDWKQIVAFIQEERDSVEAALRKKDKEVDYLEGVIKKMVDLYNTKGVVGMSEGVTGEQCAAHHTAMETKMSLKLYRILGGLGAAMLVGVLYIGNYMNEVDANSDRTKANSQAIADLARTVAKQMKLQSDINSKTAVDITAIRGDLNVIRVNQQYIKDGIKTIADHVSK